ncbi:hypothetical protein BBP10_11025 [Limosilactobacillus reuteri]|nr:hypothetical protein BBP10_11025 [Limosilactobacillus reuteri]
MACPGPILFWKNDFATIGGYFIKHQDQKHQNNYWLQKKNKKNKKKMEEKEKIQNTICILFENFNLSR